MGTTFLPVASIVTEVGKRDGWMSVLPGLVVGVPYGLMVISLLEQYPQKNLLQISEILLGKWMSKIVGVLYVLITGYFGGLLLGQAGDIYESSILPLAPIWLFYLGGLLLVFYLVSSGVEVFARFSEVIFPVIVIAIILNVALSMPRIEQGSLLPILGEGINPIFRSGLKVMPFAMEYILFISGIISYLSTDKRERAKLKRGVWIAVFLVGFLNTLVVLIQIAVFGPEETVRLVYGLLVLGKMVEISRTVAGVESVFMGAWFGALVIKVSALFFAVTWGLETPFKLKGLKWNLAVGVIFMGIALRFRRGPDLIMEINLVDNYLILPFASVWILSLWGISRWKKKAGVS